MEDFKFDEAAIKDAIESAKATYSDAEAAAKGAEAQSAEAQSLGFDLKGGGMPEGNMEILAQCISIRTANNRICISLPVVGRRCLRVPINIPNGSIGRACLSICTVWPGVPSGVKVSISIGGVTVIRKSFGFSC